jgi:glycine oxidase
MSTHRTTDIVIIGGGVIGCSIAYQLCKAGVAVTLVERDTIAAEASQAAAGLLAPLTSIARAFPGPLVDLLLASWRLYPALIPEIEAQSGTLVEHNMPGGLHTASAETLKTIRKRMDLFKSLDITVSWLDEKEVHELEPLAGPDVVAAIYAPEECGIKPPAMTRAFAGAARALGASILEHTEIVKLEQRGSRITGVQTALGDTIACDQLVIATGAWSARCGQWLGFTLPIYPMRGQILALGQPAIPLRHCLFNDDIYIVPKFDGSVYVGATVEQVGFDKSITVEGISWLLSRTLHHAPGLAAAPIRTIWAGLRPWSSDGSPILGKAPGWENAILATGHGRIGFELCGITGTTIAELITTGSTPALIQPFGAERFLHS